MMALILAQTSVLATAALRVTEHSKAANTAGVAPGARAIPCSPNACLPATVLDAFH